MSRIHGFSEHTYVWSPSGFMLFDLVFTLGPIGPILIGVDHSPTGRLLDLTILGIRPRTMGGLLGGGHLGILLFDYVLGGGKRH